MGVVCALLAVMLMAMTTFRLKTLVKVLQIDSMALNQAFTAAHILLLLINTVLLILNATSLDHGIFGMKL